MKIIVRLPTSELFTDPDGQGIDPGESCRSFERLLIGAISRISGVTGEVTVTVGDSHLIRSIDVEGGLGEATWPGKLEDVAAEVNERIGSIFSRRDWIVPSRLSLIVRKYTMAQNIKDLAENSGDNYWPSIRKGAIPGMKGSAEELDELAAAYDAWQERRGDPRRAYRG